MTKQHPPLQTLRLRSSDLLTTNPFHLGTWTSLPQVEDALVKKALLEWCGLGQGYKVGKRTALQGNGIHAQSNLTPTRLQLDVWRESCLHPQNVSHCAKVKTILRILHK